LWRDSPAGHEGQQPLISEAVRGEGALLLNHKGERFMVGKHELNELAPRDIVAKEIFNQMKSAHVPHVWLDATPIHDFPERFPTIFQSCIENGIDPRKQLIPVAPASHYASGGVLVDLRGRTTVEGLYACGETACTGAHGANRLASNSLLEGLVFGAAIAEDIARDLPVQSKPVQRSEESLLIDPAIRLSLQLSMTEGAGVLRSESSLKETLAQLQVLGTRRSTQPCIEAWEVSNLYLLATAIVRGALLRQESRGSHWRSDFPETSQAWKKRIVQRFNVNAEWSTTEIEVKN
jgi:L-aspartate oxidase